MSSGLKEHEPLLSTGAWCRAALGFCSLISENETLLGLSRCGPIKSSWCLYSGSSESKGQQVASEWRSFCEHTMQELMDHRNFQHYKKHSRLQCQVAAWGDAGLSLRAIPAELRGAGPPPAPQNHSAPGLHYQPGTVAVLKLQSRRVSPANPCSRD